MLKHDEGQPADGESRQLLFRKSLKRRMSRQPMNYLEEPLSMSHESSLTSLQFDPYRMELT
jgi:hypothetical protein